MFSITAYVLFKLHTSQRLFHLEKTPYVVFPLSCLRLIHYHAGQLYSHLPCVNINLCKTVHTHVSHKTYLPCIPLFSNVVNTSNFPDFCTGLYTIAPYPPVAPAQPRAAAAAPPPASARHDMRFGPAVNSLKILESTASKRMPYESMAYKTMETDSKSGSKSGFTPNPCHILNDTTL